MTTPTAGRILVVDDDEAIGAVTQATLELLGGLSVAIATSGDRAMAMCRDEEFDLILIDVMMPNLDGPSTIRRLQGSGLLERTPFAFLTAKVQPDAREALLSLGAAEVIAKPFDLTSLVEVVRRLLAGRP